MSYFSKHPFRLACCLLALAVTCVAQQSEAKKPAPKPSAPAAAPKQDANAHPLAAKALGIQFAVLSSKVRRSIIRTKSPYGFAVRKVAKGSLAAAAGIKKGTIILKIDGKPFRQVAELETVLKAAKPGQVISVDCSDRKKKAKLFGRRWDHRVVKLVLPKKQGEQAKKVVFRNAIAPAPAPATSSRLEARRR